MTGQKILTSMVKTRSPHQIIFLEDPEDSFMIHVARVRIKTGCVIDESLILRPDIEQWISSYKQKGFFIQ